jgi:hypothetical protein
MLRIPHWLDSQITDGSEVPSPMQQPRSTPPETLFFCSWYNFCLRLSKPQGLERPEALGKLKKTHSPHRVSNPRLCSLKHSPQPLHYRVHKRRPICFTQYANIRICNSSNSDTGLRLHYLWTLGTALVLWVTLDMTTFQVHIRLLLFIHSSIIHTQSQLAWNHKGVWSHWGLRSTDIQFIY